MAVKFSAMRCVEEGCFAPVSASWQKRRFAEAQKHGKVMMYWGQILGIIIEEPMWNVGYIEWLRSG